MQWCSTCDQKPFAQQVQLLPSFQNIASSMPECFSTTSKASFREFAVPGRLKWLDTSGSSQAWVPSGQQFREADAGMFGAFAPNRLCVFRAKPDWKRALAC
jgi:hypothetical protein